MLTAKNVTKEFAINSKVLPVLKGISLTLNEGGFVSIVGRSGSGKTTLLNFLSTLVKPGKGDLHYLDIDLRTLSDSRLNKLRQNDFSVIFQFHHLLSYLNVLENNLLPFMRSTKPVKKEAVSRAWQCLQRFFLQMSQPAVLIRRRQGTDYATLVGVT